MHRLILLASFVAAISAQSPYSSFCLQNQFGADQQNYFADSTDCHYYISCDFFNSSFAIGTRQKCPEGQFWRPTIVSCLPEGAVPCVDRCMSEEVVRNRGCYAGAGCKQYFLCAHTGSYGMCCPDGSSFDEATCSCGASTTCNDACEQIGAEKPTTVKPSEQLNATVCRDSFGAVISVVPGENNAYVLLTEEGVPTGKQYCSPGTLFEFSTCRCGIEDPNAVVPPVTEWRKANLVLTFDADTQDSSVSGYKTFLYNGAERDTASPAVGTGSLAANGGFLTVPGFKSFDTSHDDGTLCFFFRGTSGGLVSNSRDSTNQEYSYRIGFANPNTIKYSVKYWIPDTVVDYEIPFTNAPNSWNHLCNVHNLVTNEATLYINGQSFSQTLPGGHRFISHAPMRIGNDPEWGSMNGNIDEVVAGQFAMTADEVALLRAGNYATLNFLN